jgi:hypothetical protein
MFILVSWPMFAAVALFALACSTIVLAVKGTWRITAWTVKLSVLLVVVLFRLADNGIRNRQARQRIRERWGR